jgi:hypothetical protein
MIVRPFTVTFSGADDQTDPRAMDDLCRKFPFIEWGILLSISKSSRSRYPSPAWLLDLDSPHLKYLRFSVHLCGTLAMMAARGEHVPMPSRASRVQINGAAIPSPDNEIFCAAIEQPIILQARDLQDLERAAAFNLQRRPVSVLIDPSGGRGQHTELSKFLLSPGDQKDPTEAMGAMPVGFAGGLGPYRLSSVLREIEARSWPIGWIDMESSLRTPQQIIGAEEAPVGDTLSLEVCETVARAVDHLVVCCAESDHAESLREICALCRHDPDTCLCDGGPLIADPHAARRYWRRHKRSRLPQIDP